ncbi:hypothetical protein F5J12DRAFT_787665 [Pisolithus orientalis]|uniref:uncharacterized protein n=1 Tax=Pisolithus orientalis TaxID=936130 RepID=UPI002224352F|nr:uncharacterized protein F5J12DRAFT_787665 [Pisolithus orientalis]KAI5984117.1 hypothetical protein F5J12DRAFT_787665 [Pisolithus orientalis]
MSTNTAARTPKVTKEVAATREMDEIGKLLNKVQIGWGLMCVATSDDLGHGPQLKCGLETAAQLTPYKNFIQWSGKATGPGAEMFLINGNHCVTLIQTLYKKDIVHCQDAIVMICEGQNESQKGDAAKELEKTNEKLSQKAVWLVEFFDLSNS